MLDSLLDSCLVLRVRSSGGSGIDLVFDCTIPAVQVNCNVVGLIVGEARHIPLHCFIFLQFMPEKNRQDEPVHRLRFGFPAFDLFFSNILPVSFRCR